MLLNQLIQILDLPDSDYWREEGVLRAREILSEHHESILTAIVKEWHHWPEHRQIHMAVVLEDGGLETKMALLKEMMKTKHLNVVNRLDQAVDEYRNVDKN